LIATRIAADMDAIGVEVGDLYDAPNDLLWPQSGIVNPG
jgi:hypothetical protein